VVNVRPVRAAEPPSPEYVLSQMAEDTFSWYLRQVASAVTEMVTLSLTILIYTQGSSFLLHNRTNAELIIP
jgi:hypothetical protein